MLGRRGSLFWQILVPQRVGFSSNVPLRVVIWITLCPETTAELDCYSLRSSTLSGYNVIAITTTKGRVGFSKFCAGKGRGFAVPS